MDGPCLIQLWVCLLLEIMIPLCCCAAGHWKEIITRRHGKQCKWKALIFAVWERGCKLHSAKWLHCLCFSGSYHYGFSQSTNWAHNCSLCCPLKKEDSIHSSGIPTHISMESVLDSYTSWQIFLVEIIYNSPRDNCFIAAHGLPSTWYTKAQNDEGFSFFPGCCPDGCLHPSAIFEHPYSSCLPYCSA